MVMNMDFDEILSAAEYDFLRDDERLGDNVILLGLGGSLAYGTNNENSDIDIERMANIMRKTFELEDLDCANCAAKMEEAIKKLPGVKRVSVNFMTQKMILDAEDSQFDEILQAAVKCIAKVEPDCRVVL